MKGRSFKLKIIIPTVSVLVVLVVVINVFLSIRLSGIGNSLIEDKLASVANSLKYYLDESKGKTNVAARSAAINADVIGAVSKRDTDELLRLLTPACDLYNIDYFTVTDGDGIVLARTYDPESLGDPVTNQQNIKNALEGGISTYFESGTYISVSIRTGVPVYDADHTLIGAVSAGVRLDTESRAEELKELFEAEVTVFLGDTRIATTIVKNGQSITGTSLDPGIAETVLENKREYSGDADVLGEKYKTFYLPLLNARNDAFAAVVTGIPLADLTADTTGAIIDGIIIGLCGLAVSAMLLFLMISSLSRPITKLSSDMSLIANGNLGIDVAVSGNDEVGNLGKSLQRVANILYKLLAEINKTIGEHERGNVDYFLDTEEFFGDYKTLAVNIMELTALGMRDQLTGIPNRRTFDNRLDMEWSRSVRDGSPLGILIMDVDKFKNYNDSFGHQQGDAALKTAAKTITRSLRRPTDFAARWGGEEFVALLPSTDAAGAVIVAEHIRAQIEKAAIPCADKRAAHVTVSIGINALIPGRSCKKSEFIAAADAALYKAKETGRNKAVLHAVTGE